MNIIQKWLNTLIRKPQFTKPEPVKNAPSNPVIPDSSPEKTPEIMSTTKPLITPAQLQQIAPFAKNTEAWAGHLNAAMAKYEINTPLRIAAFLGQILHESGQLRYVREIWGPTPAQARYEGRKDLGNTQPGDGKRFMGRGLIQITGRSNYTQAQSALNLPLLTRPELLEQPENAAMSAAWWWSSRNLNGWADKGDYIRITKIINGGMNGWDDRLKLYNKAKKVLGM